MNKHIVALMQEIGALEAELEAEFAKRRAWLRPQPPESLFAQALNGTSSTQSPRSGRPE